MKIITTILFVILTTVTSCAQSKEYSYKKITDSKFNVGDKIRLPEIRFSLSGGSKILDYNLDSLKMVADFLKSHKSFTVELGAHTDNRGSENVNLNLSKKRAKQVKDFFVNKYLISEEKIKIVGYGESKPIISDEEIQNAESSHEKERLHQVNRRFEIKIIDK